MGDPAFWQGLPLPIRNEMIRRAHGIVQGDVMGKQLDYGEIATVVIGAMVEGYAMCRSENDERPAG